MPLRCSGWKTKSPSHQLLPPVAVDAGSTSPWADLADGTAGADADDTAAAAAAAAAALWVTVGFFFAVCARRCSRAEGGFGLGGAASSLQTNASCSLPLSPLAAREVIAWLRFWSLCHCGGDALSVSIAISCLPVNSTFPRKSRSSFSSSSSSQMVSVSVVCLSPGRHGKWKTASVHAGLSVSNWIVVVSLLFPYVSSTTGSDVTSLPS